MIYEYLPVCLLTSSLGLSSTILLCVSSDFLLGSSCAALLAFTSFLDVLLGFLFEEGGDAFLVIGHKIDAAHEGLKGFGNADSLLGLVVLEDAAHGALGSAKGSVEHVNEHFVLALLFLAEL